MSTRLLIIQVGNYAEAVHRFAAGGEETYYAQRYSVESVRDLARGLDATTVLSFASDPHDEVVEGGVRSVGLRLFPEGGGHPDMEGLLARVAGLDPTHIILASPLRQVIAWALGRGVRVLPWLADSFLDRKPRARLRAWRLFRLLKDKRIDIISNHNVNSCLNLADHGIPPSTVVPWDWPPVVTPDRFPPKDGPARGPFRMVFVGQISVPKGLGDAIDALALLAARGRDASLTVAGRGDVGPFAEQAGRLGIADRVHFRGLVPHHEVLGLMRDHDAVLVPSRHDYPEGLPMTIYEAYCSRTPLVASDHPMFRGKVIDGDAALVFPAGRADLLAERVERLAAADALYSGLSAASEAAWQRLQCPVRPHELFARWISDGPEDRRWLADHSLASGRYHTENPSTRRTPPSGR